MCERCWGKAFTAAYGISSKTQAGEYERIVASCACTPAQRRGVTDSFAEGYAAREKAIEELRARVKELELEVEITAREALDRIAELEGRVPKWVGEAEHSRLLQAGWSIAGPEQFWHRPPGAIEAEWHWLMVPPIPLPEGER